MPVIEKIKTEIKKEKQKKIITPNNKMGLLEIQYTNHLDILGVMMLG